MVLAGTPKITKGMDFNKFARITVDGYFGDFADVSFNFRFTNLSFTLVHEGSGVVEYSFNGNTVHGDMTAGTTTASLSFDNRKVPAIWFRAADNDALGATVRVEGWAV
jgi:hypothetical protein